MGKLFILQYEGEGSRLSRKKEYTGNVRQHGLHISHNQMSLVQVRPNIDPYTNDDDNKIVLESHSLMKGAHPNWLENKKHQDSITDKDNVFDNKETASADKKLVPSDSVSEPFSEKIIASKYTELHERLSQVYDKVLVVDSIPAARQVVRMLTTRYKDLIHACDTEACIGLL